MDQQLWRCTKSAGKKADGSWKAFSIPFIHLENAVGQIVVDDINQLWIVSPKDNGVFCYNYGQSIDNTRMINGNFTNRVVVMAIFPAIMFCVY
jgi:hypothetical protein